MSRSRWIHTLFLFTLPLLVSWWGWSVMTTCGLLLLLLLWRWLITLSSISGPVTGPDLILDSIPASHFVEKVRWCMDQLGVDYVERPSGGTLGAFFLGRTVPRLRFRTGVVQSSIGNSAEILRYLWGRYSASSALHAEFLRPDPARLELEARIDRCGRDLQVWVYYHLLPHRKLTLRVWGVDDPAIPWWQRKLLGILFPLLRVLIRRAFSINQIRYRKAIEHVDALLSNSESRLHDQQVSLLAGDAANFVDFSFAAINALWLQPKEYGGGTADNVRLEGSQLPAAMREDIQSWTTRYPLSTAFINQLYQQRLSTPAKPDLGLHN